MQYIDRPATLFGCSLVLIILSSVLVILRLISRRLCAAKLWWDDALIVLSLVSLIAWIHLTLKRVLIRPKARLLSILPWEHVQYLMTPPTDVPKETFLIEISSKEWDGKTFEDYLSKSIDDNTQGLSSPPKL